MYHCYFKNCWLPNDQRKINKIRFGRNKKQMKKANTRNIIQLYFRCFGKCYYILVKQKMPLSLVLFLYHLLSRLRQKLNNSPMTDVVVDADVDDDIDR